MQYLAVVSVQKHQNNITRHKKNIKEVDSSVSLQLFCLLRLQNWTAKTCSEFAFGGLHTFLTATHASQTLTCQTLQHQICHKWDYYKSL